MQTSTVTPAIDLNNLTPEQLRDIKAQLNKQLKEMSTEFKPWAERGEYQGKPTLTLRRNETEKFGFSFGVNKARMILACLPDIKAFVESTLDK